MLLSCDDAWFGDWRGPSLLRLEGGRLSYAGAAGAGSRTGGTEADEALGHTPGVVLAPFTDSHVHLGLVDAAALRRGGIGRVVDLGWDPAVAESWPAHGADPESDWPEVSIAGGLHGAPGGYPLRSGWAPPEAAVPIAGPDDAVDAVARAMRGGASLLKITLNSDAGPVWDDDVLDAVVRVAHDARLPVVAHAQGFGQARRAARAGVDALAHTPWTERLDDDLLDDIAPRMAWMSTLDIHGHGAFGDAFEIAVDNLARFAARGGTVLYGTDLGNGPLPAGLNGRELAALVEAGLDLAGILRALTPGSGDEGFDTRLVTWLPARPSSVADLAAARIDSLPDLVRRSE
jgi:hypothetical protein